MYRSNPNEGRSRERRPQRPVSPIELLILSDDEPDQSIIYISSSDEEFEPSPPPSSGLRPTLPPVGTTETIQTILANNRAKVKAAQKLRYQEEARVKREKTKADPIRYAQQQQKRKEVLQAKKQKKLEQQANIPILPILPIVHSDSEDDLLLIDSAPRVFEQSAPVPDLVSDSEEDEAPVIGQITQAVPNYENVCGQIVEQQPDPRRMFTYFHMGFQQAVELWMEWEEHDPELINERQLEFLWCERNHPDDHTDNPTGGVVYILRNFVADKFCPELLSDINLFSGGVNPRMELRYLSVEDEEDLVKDIAVYIPSDRWEKQEAEKAKHRTPVVTKKTSKKRKTRR
jgi:hypothetical protein